MKRLLYANLLEWKDGEHRKPLLLTGARQVGKTYLLKEFGATEFSDVLYLNFDSERDKLETFFDGSINPSNIISKLETIYQKTIDPANTLIIFDEIQEIPRALASLKYFCEEAPEYHVAASGSFLGIALHQGTSFPVGKVDLLELSPLSFEEFLIASGHENLLNAADDESLLPVVSNEMSLLFREYLIVGGMPEAVASWITEHNYERIDTIHDAILSAYWSDISKHTDATTATRIHQVWESLPAQFAKRNEKFMFNVVKEGARAREYELAVQWLIDCKFVRKVNRLTAGDKLPLKAYTDLSSFKLYSLDVGLLRRMAGISSETILDDEILFKEFNGLFVEQFVLQQLASKRTLFYWSSSSTAEVDFVTEIDNKIVPIEVKSGTNVKAKSLRVFRDLYHPELAIRFSMRPLKYDDGLLNLPIYLAGMEEKFVDRIK